MSTQIGFGIQPGTYIVDITTGTFMSYNSASTSGSFNIIGTWEGGFGEGTLEISGQWIADSSGIKGASKANIIIGNDITTSWTANSTTLRDTAVNLISNGGLGQTSETVSPIEIFILNKVLLGENTRWRVNFLKDLWYSYDKNNPGTKYFFDDSLESSFAIDHIYTTSEGSAGTFFDVSVNSYYTSFGGENGTIYGENIEIVSSGHTDVAEAGASLILRSKLVDQQALSVSSISPIDYVEQIPPDTIVETTSVIFSIPPSNHVGRNILKCQTVAIKDLLLSDANNDIYKITCAPPGLFSGENYVISPNDEASKAWRYFYHLTSNATSVEEANDGTYVVKNVRAEFPNSIDVESKDNWITGDLDINFKFTFDSTPITNYNVHFNTYIPRQSKMFAWSGKGHFGVIIGEPGSDSVKKYLIY